MLAAQAIYGPHDERHWSAGSLALGRCLFRTLPEDEFDRQPVHSADGRLTRNITSAGPPPMIRTEFFNDSLTSLMPKKVL